jgi:hypothetical protein
MSINPVSPENIPQPTATTAKPVAAEKPKQQPAAAQDEFKPAQQAKIAAALASQPDARPEMVEKAKQLAADPNYPSADQLAKIAKMFVDEQS